LLQTATLLGTGPPAPKRLLGLGLIHLQQGIQRELSRDLLRGTEGKAKSWVSSQLSPRNYYILSL
jgi:hypothetical protein